MFTSYAPASVLTKVPRYWPSCSPVHCMGTVIVLPFGWATVALTVASFNSTRDTLVATNAKVKDLDVTKVIEDKYVADAEKRGVGK